MAGVWLNYEFHRVFADLENRQRNRIENRLLRDNSNPFLIADAKFKKLFRLPKVIVQNLIEEITPLVEPSVRLTAVPIHLKVLIMLNFVVHGGYQTTVGEDMNLAVSQPVVSRIIKQITSVVGNQLFERYVIFPVDEEHIAQVKQRFQHKFGFPNVIGAIDCTHIAISGPTNNENNPTITYWNRKGYYSINVQTICDSDLNILAMNARYPGATHDSAIWAMSAVHQHLRRKYEEGIRNMWLIGDAGYSLEPWLMTPINDAPEDTPEGRYTARHCSARNTIERCFGVLKQRFRCLLKHRVLHYSHEIASNIIYTCAVLHNLCIQNNINLEEEVDVPDFGEDMNGDDNNDEVNAGNLGMNWLAEGQRIRRGLVNMFEREL